MICRDNWSVDSVREALFKSDEIALVDVREEHFFALGHPLWAANIPLSTLEEQVRWRIPRFDTRIILYGRNEEWTGVVDDLATLAQRRLLEIGYSCVGLLHGGIEAWKRSGCEIFIDVNVPSKAFGELVEHELFTPSLSANELRLRLDEKQDVVVVDVRTFPEYEKMSIPGGVSLPGGEAVLRIRELLDNESQTVVVNCAGRTRSIIGAQSLINAGLRNPVFALRNGTMGWLLEHQHLSQGASTRAPHPRNDNHLSARYDARSLADRAGVGRLTLETLGLLRDSNHTVYVYDVRTPEEYETGHLPDSSSAPGGQLLQETDWYAPVRGARLVLVDDDGVRANMAASWLAQMGWNAYVLDNVPNGAFSLSGPEVLPYPSSPEVALISANELRALIDVDQNAAQIIDLSSSVSYANAHIPGAWYVMRTRLAHDVGKVPSSTHYVLTSHSDCLARFAAKELAAQLSAATQSARVSVLMGGTDAWMAAGFAIERGLDRALSPIVDRFARPYNGILAKHADMRAYLGWELGLVAQLERDGTHNFRVMRPESKR